MAVTIHSTDTSAQPRSPAGAFWFRMSMRLFKERLDGRQLSPQFFGHRTRLQNAVDDVWRDQDNELGARIVVLRIPERIAQHGNLLQERNAGFRFGLALGDEAAKRDGFAVLHRNRGCDL